MKTINLNMLWCAVQGLDKPTEENQRLDIDLLGYHEFSSFLSNEHIKIENKLRRVRLIAIKYYIEGSTEFQWEIEL